MLVSDTITLHSASGELRISGEKLLAQNVVHLN